MQPSFTFSDPVTLYLQQYEVAFRTAVTQMQSRLDELSTFYSSNEFNENLDYFLHFKGNPQIWFQKFNSFKHQLADELAILTSNYSTILAPLYEISQQDTCQQVFPYFENQRNNAQNYNEMVYLDMVRYVSSKSDDLRRAMNTRLDMQRELVENYNRLQKFQGLLSDDVNLKEKLSSLLEDFQHAALPFISSVVDDEFVSYFQTIYGFETNVGNGFENEAKALAEKANRQSKKALFDDVNALEISITKFAQNISAKQESIELLFKFCRDANEVLLKKADLLTQKHSNLADDITEFPFTLGEAKERIDNALLQISEISVIQKAFWKKHSTIKARKMEKFKRSAKIEGSRIVDTTLNKLSSNFENQLQKLQKQIPPVPTLDFKQQIEEISGKLNEIADQEQLFQNILTNVKFLQGPSFKSLAARSKRIRVYPSQGVQQSLGNKIHLINRNLSEFKERGHAMEQSMEERIQTRIQEKKAINEAIESLEEQLRARVDEFDKMSHDFFSKDSRMEEINNFKNEANSHFKDAKQMLDNAEKCLKEKSERPIQERVYSTKEELEEALKPYLELIFIGLRRDMKILSHWSTNMEYQAEGRLAALQDITELVGSVITKELECMAVVAYSKVMETFRQSLLMIHLLRGGLIEWENYKLMLKEEREKNDEILKKLRERSEQKKIETKIKELKKRYDEFRNRFVKLQDKANCVHLTSVRQQGDIILIASNFNSRNMDEGKVEMIKVELGLLLNYFRQYGDTMSKMTERGFVQRKGLASMATELEEYEKVTLNSKIFNGLQVKQKAMLQKDEDQRMLINTESASI